ncbi:S1 family peptidase [Bradyrhizobium oligotrophicum]|uniref:S1 family peptidase n=1 Tax=Bradyrhizobium oligotrophicum TaxID=44255 RepID=UPI003EB6E349
MLCLSAHRGKAAAHGNGIFPTIAILLCFFLALFISVAPLSAKERSPEIELTYVEGLGPAARVVNGIPTTWYPTVGALLHRNGNAFGSLCTATLIGCNTVLTAAHCVVRDVDVRNYRMFFQHGGLATIKSISWQKKDYREPSRDGEQADIAVLQLGEPITGIAPFPINQDYEHEPNVPGIIVGFGRTGGSANNFGLKRYGPVKSADCGKGFAKNEMICWDFSGGGSNTCSGDSGGPLFVSESREQEVISGVTSGGQNSSCLSSDHSFDTSVFRYSAWVKASAGADLGTKACGPVVPLSAKFEENDKRFKPVSGQLSSASPRHVFEIRTKDAQVLRVGVNVAKFIEADAQETAASPRIIIAKGQTRDGANTLCRSDAAGAAAFCSVAGPEDDQIYTIVLDRVGNQGRADFQLVVSVF